MSGKPGDKKERRLPDTPPGEFEHMFLYSSYTATSRTRSKLLDKVDTAKKAEPSLMQKAFGIMLFLILISLPNFLIRILFDVAGTGTSLIICGLITLWIVYVIRYGIFSPQAVQVGAEGIRLHWMHTLWSYTSPWIGWEDIDYAVVRSYARKNLLWTYQSTSVNLVLSKGAEARAGRYFSWMIPQIIGRRQSFGQLELQLDRNAFVREQDLSLLTHTIKHYLSPDRVDESIDSLSLPEQDVSYTELWLDEFNSRKAPIAISERDRDVLHSRYKIIRELASGGLSTTYLATVDGDKGEEERKVVLKEITLPTGGGKEILQRALINVRKEADLLKSLDHPQIVKCEDLFIEGKNAYICLEFVEGETLRQLVSNQGPLNEPDARAIGEQILSILEYLHGLEPPIIHRDLSPDNLIIDESGKVTLIDFNVAEQNEGIETHTVVGKRNYIPPEQFRGKWSQQSDIYAFGCCLYWLLTGHDPEAIATSHPGRERDGLSPDLDEIVARATQIDTGRRYTRVCEVTEDLTGSKLRVNESAPDIQKR